MIHFLSLYLVNDGFNFKINTFISTESDLVRSNWKFALMSCGEHST